MILGNALLSAEEGVAKLTHSERACQQAMPGQMPLM
jgi:hypothetical protein